MRAGFETKQFIKFMCVHFGRIINCDRICIEFRVDKFYQHKFFGCDIKIYWCVLMPRLNESVGDRSSLFNLKKFIHSFIHSFILGSGLSYTLPCLRPGPINQSSNPNAYIAGTMETYNYGHPKIIIIHNSIMGIHNSNCIFFKKDGSNFNMRLSLPIMQLRISMINYGYS